MIAAREEIWGAQSSPEKGDGYGQYGSIWINMDQ